MKKKYEVEVMRIAREFIEVEAEDEDEALDLAEKRSTRDTGPRCNVSLDLDIYNIEVSKWPEGEGDND